MMIHSPIVWGTIVGWPLALMPAYEKIVVPWRLRGMRVKQFVIPAGKHHRLGR